MRYLKVNKVPMLFQSYREAFARVSADGLDSVTYLSAWLQRESRRHNGVSLSWKTGAILEDTVAFDGREDRIRRGHTLPAPLANHRLLEAFI